jgi:hypothetical protein
VRAADVACEPCAECDPGGRSQAARDVSTEAAKSAEAEPSASRSDQDAAWAQRSTGAERAQRVAGRISGNAGVGALRGGALLEWGSGRRRLKRGEKRFPCEKTTPIIGLQKTQHMCCVIRMIPDFTPLGCLPAGIHAATWAEVLQRFAVNSHRRRLLFGFERACIALKLAGCTKVFLDGSFVTEKEYPHDYDACWDTVGVAPTLLDPVLLDFRNDRAAQKTKFLGELFPATDIADRKSRRLFLDFFQHDKDTDDPKGIVRLDLKDFK